MIGSLQIDLEAKPALNPAQRMARKVRTGESAQYWCLGLFPDFHGGGEAVLCSSTEFVVKMAKNNPIFPGFRPDLLLDASSSLHCRGQPPGPV